MFWFFDCLMEESFFVVQNKLQNLAGQHSDVLEKLTPAVRKRVEVLREIQARILMFIMCVIFMINSGASF